MEVPEDFRFRYMERRKRDLEVCRMSIIQRNFDELERVGHQLRGNASTFGFNDLSTIGHKMEAAAATEDIEEIEKAFKDFSTWVHRYLN